MPPYCPAAQRLAPVVDKLCDVYGCVKKTARPIKGPRGRVVPQYLVRIDEAGQKYVAPLPTEEPHFSVLPSVIRSICAQLGLDLHNTDFGVLSDAADPDLDDDDEIRTS